MKKDNKIKILTITLITAIIMAVSSITIYSNVCAPKFYDYFIDTGIKYLTDGKYEEAILAFNKAIEIEEKSTEARVYLAKGYVGNNEPEKAIEVLEEAQNLDITNEELLKEILNILNEIDSDIAYEFLERFINEVGKENISEYIKNILNSAYEAPTNPIVDPVPGTYIDKISLRLKLDKIKVGHSYYYTIDGSKPTRESNKYVGKIDISESTTIKLIGYNKNEEATDVITLDYMIDSSILEEINKLIDEAQMLCDTVKEGTNIGNCIEGTKDDFASKLNYSKKCLNKSLIHYDYAYKVYTNLKDAIQEFKNNIIEETDKSELVSIINKAQNLYDKAKEGSNINEYKSGSKNILLKSINSAKKINDKLIAKQIYIDKEVRKLESAIDKFNNSKNEGFTEEVALKYLVDSVGADATRKVNPYDGDVHYEVEVISYSGPYIEDDPYVFTISDDMKIIDGKKVFVVCGYFDGYKTYAEREFYVFEDGSIYISDAWVDWRNPLKYK